jgi:hypothetical protein
MLRNINPDILIGILIASLFWVGVFVWQSSQLPNHTSVASQHCEGTRSECAKVTTDERIADYTWWLAVLTGGLVFAGVIQFGFLIRSDNTARIAATAADLSAKAATAIEFPVVRTNWMGPELMATDEIVRPNSTYGGAVNDGWPTRFSVISDIEFRNYGRTPAFAEQISLGIRVTDRLAGVPHYTDIVRCEPNTVIGARDNGEIEIHFGFELADEQIRMIEKSDAVLWFYGKLTFRDVLDRPHDTGFCWQWGRQNEADGISYFFDDGSAPAAYVTKT